MLNTIEVKLRKHKGIQFIDTYYLGFRLEVQSEIAPHQVGNKWFITYDNEKAGLLIKQKCDQKGNLELYNFLCIKA